MSEKQNEKELLSELNKSVAELLALKDCKVISEDEYKKRREKIILTYKNEVAKVLLFK